jgi:hypothetical protein
MRIRAFGMAALATAIAVGGLAGGVGTASAKKVALNGTLTCFTSGTTTISPGIVLTSALLPKGKDKKPKYTTTGASTSCEGTTTSGIQPTSFTLTSKAKGNSRLLVGAPCETTGRATKMKITFNTGDKLKVVLTGDLQNYAFNAETEVSTPFPACGSGLQAAVDFATAHAGDRIEVRSEGTSTGKAYAGKTVVSDSVTSVTLAQELGVSQTPTGVTSLSADPEFSSLEIG